MLALTEAGRSRTTFSCWAAREIWHPESSGQETGSEEATPALARWSASGVSLQRIGAASVLFVRFLILSLGPRPSYYPRFPSASRRSSSRPAGAASGSRMLGSSHRGPRRDQLLSTSRKPSSPKRCAWGSTADRVSYRNSFYVSLSPSQRLPRTSNVSSTT